MRAAATSAFVAYPWECYGNAWDANPVSGRRRCDDCRHAQAAYQADYRIRRANGEVGPSSVAQLQPAGAGRVELAVQRELEGLPAAESRPGLAQAALALGRVLDNPRVMSPHPSAARVLARLLDELRRPMPGRRGGLKLVRAMSEKGKGGA